MRMTMSLFISLTLRFFFLLTPFFGLSMFISMTSEYPPRERRLFALRVASAIIVIGLVLLFFGSCIFRLFGITVDAFRIGTGILLMLTAISLMNPDMAPAKREFNSDIAVVPLAFPVFIGPATTGALVVLSADVASAGEKMIVALAWIAAVVCIGVMLFLAAMLEHWLGRKGLGILMRLTALILSALSAQMIMIGVQEFLK